MDFLDFPAYAVDEPTTLPQPASRLSLATLSLNDNQKETEFVVPKSDEEESEFKDLHSKMKHYAEISLTNVITTSTSEKSGKPLKLQVEKPSTNQVLSKKINNLISSPLYTNYNSDMEIKHALQILQSKQSALDINFNQLVSSDFIGTLNRKSLRSKLENAMLNSHSDILSSFQPIARRIKRLSGPLGRITDSMEKFNESKDVTTFQFDSVKDRLIQLKARRQIMVKLRDSLTLTQVELDHLQNGSIDSYFFQVLDKVNFIKEKATYLLSSDETTSAGDALLRGMNLNLNISNKRIYNYLMDFMEEYDTMSKQYGERTIGDESLIKFQTSLIHVSNDVQFFQNFLNRIVSLRSKRLMDDFLSQFDLDNKSLQRPIILSADDPVRYLGDILAYVYSMIVNELEFLKSIFKIKSELITTDSILKDNMDYVVDLHFKLLNEIFNSLSNTIRIRLEQIVRFENDPLLNIDIVQFLSLYQTMLVKNGINESNKLITSLSDSECMARSKITKNTVLFLEAMDKNQIKPADLLPPDWFTDYLSKLAQLLTKLDQLNETAILTEDFYDKLIVDPIENQLMKYVQDWFPNAKKQEEQKIQLLIVQVNCFDLIRSRLGPFHGSIFSSGYGSKIYAKLDAQCSSFVGKLLETMNTYLFKSCGFELYYNLFNMIFPVQSVQDELDHEMYLSSVENPIMKLSVIHENVHAKLNHYLPLTLTDFQDVKLFNLVSPSVEETIVSTCFNNFMKFYQIFRSVLFKLYPEDVSKVTQTLNFSNDEVSTLLGIQN